MFLYGLPVTKSILIRQLTRDVIAASVDRFLDIARDVPGEYWREEHFLLDLPEKWRLSLGAWQDMEPVGYAIVSRKPDSTAHLHHFMIASNQRRRGLGTQLLSAMIAKCHQAGCIGVSLKLAHQNAGAQRFYQRHGFSKAGDVGGYQIMRLNLASDGPFFA